MWNLTFIQICINYIKKKNMLIHQMNIIVITNEYKLNKYNLYQLYFNIL